MFKTVIAASAAALVAAASAGSWDLGERAPDAPAQLDDFAFLIGCYDVAARLWRPEIGDAGDWGAGAPARWDGRWALDGWAIYDEWYNPQIPGQPDDLGRGANIRRVDPETGLWSMAWVHTTGVSRLLEAEKRGDEVVMWQVEPRGDTDRKSVFIVGDDGDWARETFVRPWGADDWIPASRLEAHKVSCDTRG